MGNSILWEKLKITQKKKKNGNHREALKLFVFKTLSNLAKETLFIQLCNEYVLCLERFDEREQSITRNVIWIVMKKKKW